MDLEKFKTEGFQSEEKLFGFDTIEATLPFETADPEDVTEFFAKKKIVPYAGNLSVSGDNLLNFYNKMAEFTPTSSACIESKKIVSFGSRLRIVKRFDNIFDLEPETEEQVSPDEKKKYVEAIRKITFRKDGDIKATAEELYREYESNGNMWLEVIMYEVAGVKKTEIVRHEQTNCRYIYEDATIKIVGIANKWTKTYIEKNGMREIPLYPYSRKDGSTIRTIIHEKNGKFWYGKPPSKGSVLDQYAEYIDMYYQLRLASNDFTVKTILEVEDDANDANRLLNNKRDKAAGFRSTVDRFSKNFTNKSKDPQRLLLLTRPVNSKPMFVHEMQNNTNERYFEKMANIHSGRIIQSHSWSIRLLGGNTSSYFSTGVYIDELKVKDATSNMHNQYKVENILRKAIDLGFDHNGDSEDKDTTFVFTSPYLNLVKNEASIKEKFGEDSVQTTDTPLI